MDLKYAYIAMDALFMVIWLGLFLLRKNVRKEMIVMSVIFGFVSFPAELVFVHDWWNPLRITNTPLGIEDFLFGFATVGIATVLYEEVFRKKIYPRKIKGKYKLLSLSNFTIYSVIFALIFLISFQISHNSLLAAILAFCYGIIIIYIKRPDLISDSLITGILFVSLPFIVYPIVNILTPGWVDKLWFFQNVPHVTILNVSLDDIIYYFLAGCFWGPLYEYWQRVRLIKNS